MLRDTVVRELDHDPRFTWRGESVTRIENLSDIVFALALGMLVSSAQRPETFNDLTRHLFTIIPVAAGFALLFSVWNAHFTYFRRYGVADGRIVFLNCILLLFVLFVAYPLRFIFDGLFGYILFLITEDPGLLNAAEMTYENSGIMMGYFTGGYALIYIIISLMYAHALSKAEVLGLTETEMIMTKRSIIMFWVIIVNAVVTGLLAVLTPMNAFAGCIMALNGPASMIVGRLMPLPEVSERGAANG